MKKIIAVNGSPRTGWNTDMLVRAAAGGAASEGAEVEVIDLYKLEKYTGCISCFACKTKASLGRCACRDGLKPVLDKIRGADGLIIGSPIYLGDISAGVRALYERLIFQYITYKKEVPSYAECRIPVLFILTSNVAGESYARTGYDEMAAGYLRSFENFIGPAKLLISGDTYQTDGYPSFGWTIFDAEGKKKRREEIFPSELEKAREAGVAMAGGVEL